MVRSRALTRSDGASQDIAAWMLRHDACWTLQRAATGQRILEHAEGSDCVQGPGKTGPCDGLQMGATHPPSLHRDAWCARQVDEVAADLPYLLSSDHPAAVGLVQL